MDYPWLARAIRRWPGSVVGPEQVRLKKEDAAKEEAKLKKAQAKATRAQAKANKAVQGGTGQVTGWGRRCGRGGRSGGSPPAKVCPGKQS